MPLYLLGCYNYIIFDPICPVVFAVDSYRYILDIGCGDGRLVIALVNQNQTHMIGLDNSDHGFSDAKSLAKQAAIHHLVECVESDARQMAFKASHFEAVILNFSLHHIEETQPTLQEIHRILVSGGMVLIGEWVVNDKSHPRDGCYRFYS